MREYKNSFRGDNLQKLSARFLHLIQEILCRRKASEIVLERAMNTVKEEKKLVPSSESWLNWSQALLDREIDRYFKDLIMGIKQNSKECEEELFEILHERFSRLVQKKIYREQSQIEQEDGQDIVQNALKIVYEKCKTSQPKGTFIQWAQTILNNKYKEYRRKINKQRRRMKSLSEENYEPIYEKRLSDVVSKRSLSPPGENRKIAKMNTSEENRAEENIFNHAVYRWHPVELSECEDLKNHLLEIIAGMGDRCKKVFSLLFSTGDIKAIHEAFPDLSRSRIDVIISRCRKRLKQEAIKRRIL